MDTGPGFFLSPFPDETLHSLLSRYCRLTGFASVRQAFSNVEHSYTFTRNTSFPCHLKESERLLKPVTGLDTNALISRHTLLPYFQPFMSPEQLVMTRRQMESRNGQGLKMRLGLIASSLERYVRVRFCPVCLAEDDQKHGQAYWHRVHQLPGVWICPHHVQPLSIIEPVWIRDKATRCFLPTDDNLDAHALALEVSAIQRDRLYRLAALSWSALDRDCDPLQHHVLQQNLLRGAQAHALVSSTGRLRLTPLADMLSIYFKGLPSAGEFSRLCPVRAKQAPSWVLKLLRKPRGAHHPLHYLLLADALELNFDDLAVQRSVQIPMSKSIATKVTAKTGGLAHTLKEMYSEGHSLRQIGAVTGVSVSTLHVYAVQLGIHVRARPSILLPALRQQIRDQLVSGKAFSEVATDCSVSLASVYRVLRMETDLKDMLSGLRVERDRENRRLRFIMERERNTAAHACTDYAWLYRNDRVWLKGKVQCIRKIARKRTAVIDWPSLDRELSLRIRECVSSLRARPGKPLRISVALIGRELNSSTLFEKKLLLLPICSLELKATCETLDQFHHRRIEWAAKELRARNAIFGAATLLRFAAIRPPEGNAASYLMKLINEA